MYYSLIFKIRTKALETPMKRTFKGENSIPAVKRPQPQQNRSKKQYVELSIIFELDVSAPHRGVL